MSETGNRIAARNSLLLDFMNERTELLHFYKST